MPSGKTHDKMAVIFAPALLLAGYCLTDIPLEYIGLLAIGELFGGLFLSPDLDLRSKPYHRWGYIKFIWLPYQKVAKHRSALSHGWILGSWIRLLYLFIIIAPIYYFSMHPTRARLESIYENYFLHFIFFGVGVWLGALIHIMADHIVTGYRTRGKRW